MAKKMGLRDSERLLEFFESTIFFGKILQLATLHKFNNYFSLFQPNMLVFVAAFVPSLVSWRTFLAHKLKISGVFYRGLPEHTTHEEGYNANLFE